MGERVKQTSYNYNYHAGISFYQLQLVKPEGIYFILYLRASK